MKLITIVIYLNDFKNKSEIVSTPSSMSIELNFGKIDCEFMNKLELNYASVFLMERISNEFVFPDWNFSK
jgi:hypothetical protein